MIGNDNPAHEYVLLTLRIGIAVSARTGDGWMLDYSGPPEWKALVDAEDHEPGGALLEATQAAEEKLPHQVFRAQRTQYLAKRLRALGMAARRVPGKRFSLSEQVYPSDL